MYKLVSVLIAGALAVGAVGALTGSSATHHMRVAKGQGVAAAGEAPATTAPDAPAAGGSGSASDPTSTAPQTTSTTARPDAATTSSTISSTVQLAPAVHFEQDPPANQPMTATLSISPTHPGSARRSPSPFTGTIRMRQMAGSESGTTATART